MKKSVMLLYSLIVVATACLLPLAQTQAAEEAPPLTYISGAITFSDNFTLNGPFTTATALTSVTLTTVSGANGDYSSILPGTAVDFSTITAAHPFTFDPSTPYAGLWTIVAAGATYSFDIASSFVPYRDESVLVIKGTGMAYITGFAPTPGTWNLTLNQNGGLLNFSGGAAVPEPATIGFLLLGLFSFGLRLRLKF